MSQFILGVKNLQSTPIIETIHKSLIVPRLRSLLKLNSSSSRNSKSKEEIHIAQLCQKLTDKQFEDLHKKNMIELKREFHKLKKKLKKSIKTQYIEEILEKKSNQNQRLNVGQLNRFNNQQIDLNKKFNMKISQKIFYNRECVQIEQKKANYFEWLNKQNNNCLSSPNFNKMIFLLEKTKKIKDKTYGGFSNHQNYQFNSNEIIKPWDHRILLNQDKLLLKPIKKILVPKSKIKNV